jgi:two-component system, sensor histidine kinase LadS
MSELIRLQALKLRSWTMQAAFWLVSCSVMWLMSQPSLAQVPGAVTAAQDVTLQSQVWHDIGGKTSIEQVAQAGPETFQPLSQYRSFILDRGDALWMRWTPSNLTSQDIWYLQLSSSAFFDRASLFQRDAAGQWSEQRAGDRIAVSQWNHPDQTPVFKLDPNSQGSIWLRLENAPASIAPRLYVLNEERLSSQRRWSYMLLGGYFGFALLVLFLGVIHVYLYRDRAFVAYSIYVSCMLVFQLAFTGMGGLFLWPNSPWWSNAAPGMFMLLLSATGNWFVREACTLQRHSPWVDKGFLIFTGLGVILAVLYTLSNTRNLFLLLNLYGLFTVILGISACMWVWRRGERYGMLIFLGFLPLYLGYPFAALRAAGSIADNWLSQYAVLIGSAIEIPLLLFVLHMRAKELGENKARMRAIDQTDPLTGLAIEPVLTLRVRDALLRGISEPKARTLLLVELANHAEIVQDQGHAVGDRALVVAASCLVSAARELDTVCRIDTARFAMLVESPLHAQQSVALAQSIVARGLAEFANSSSDSPLRFRVVTSKLLATQFAPAQPGQAIELRSVLAPLIEAMNQLIAEPKKTIVHLRD